MDDRIFLHRDRVSNTISNLHNGVNESSLKILKADLRELDVEIIGISAPLINSLRRIMISEVPTMAIENVYIVNNTGVIVDEILAQRLGLIPIKANPKKFLLKNLKDLPTDLNTLVFRLKKSFKKPNALKSCPIYSSDLVWVPQGIQEEKFSKEEIGPVSGDILITKLAHEQEIELEAHCHKGIGKDHAKWSPVCCASYRHMPEIIILKPIIGDLAYKFKKCFSNGVIDVVTNSDGFPEAKVVNSALDSGSREVLRHPEFDKMCLLTKKHNHYIFSIESVGSIDPIEIFIESLDILIQKCKDLKNCLLQKEGQE